MITESRTRVWAGVITVLGSILWSPPLLADDDNPINTERPSFSSSPLALSSGTVQLEVGYQFTDGVVDVQTLPLALLRVGLVERWELQLSWAGINRVSKNPGSTTGLSDVGVGVKWQRTDAGATVPMALFAGLSLPTGNRAFGSDSVDPTIGIFWTYASALDWFGTATLSESDGDTTLSNGIGISVPISTRTGGFVEYVAQFPDEGGPSHTLNGGITFAPQSNFQWDVNAGVGLNDRAADLFFGAGVAYRF